MSLYEDLGLEPDAAPDELATAYRSAAKKHHPDAGGDRDAFERVSRAWMILRDPTKRARYDETGDLDDRPDNRLSVLAEWLMRAFDHAMEQCSGQFETTDIVAIMTRFFERERAEREKQILTAKEVKKKISNAIKRIRYNGEGVNLLEQLLQGRLTQVSQSLTALEAQKTDIEAAMAGVADYVWVVDPQPVQRTFVMIGASGTTSASASW